MRLYRWTKRDEEEFDQLAIKEALGTWTKLEIARMRELHSRRCKPHTKADWVYQMACWKRLKKSQRLIERLEALLKANGDLTLK